MRSIREQAPELGRLRGGIQNDKGQPESIDHWRATSVDKDRLGVLGGLYGIREPIREWQGQYEIELDTNTIECMIPGDPLFVAYELWGSGGCQRRCDGIRANVPVETPEGGHMEQVDCVCDEEGKEPGDKDACSPTTRLKVVIPQVPGIGVWLMTSGSIFAAQEMMGQMNILASIGPSGAVWADLVLEPRELKRPWEKYTRSFNVPVLRLRQSLIQLLESPRPALGAPAMAAIEAESQAEQQTAAEPPAAKPKPVPKAKDGTEPF